MDKERDSLIREILIENNLRALIFWKPDEIVMSTGYLPLWGISICLYPVYGIPIIYVPELEPTDRFPAGFIIKYFPWGTLNCKDPWSMLFETMRVDMNNIETTNIHFSFLKCTGQSSPAQISAEEPSLPIDFIDCLLKLSEGNYKEYDSEIRCLYLTKTTNEIEHISFVNKVATLGLKIFFENLIPFRTEVEIASTVETVIQTQMGKQGILYAKAWPYIMSGKNSAFGGTFSRNTGKALEDGDLVMIEMAVCVNGYWCDLTRTGSVGEIKQPQQKVFDIVKEAQNIAMNLIKPGAKAREIDSIVRDFIQQQGYGDFYKHALGHHVGFRYHDPGQGFNPSSDLILTENMIMTVEPGIYIHGLEFGIRIEDNVLVTKDGMKILSEYSIELNG